MKETLEWTILSRKFLVLYSFGTLSYKFVNGLMDGEGIKTLLDENVCIGICFIGTSILASMSVGIVVVKPTTIWEIMIYLFIYSISQYYGRENQTFDLEVDNASSIVIKPCSFDNSSIWIITWLFIQTDHFHRLTIS